LPPGPQPRARGSRAARRDREPVRPTPRAAPLGGRRGRDRRDLLRLGPCSRRGGPPPVRPPAHVRHRADTLGPRTRPPRERGPQTVTEPFQPEQAPDAATPPTGAPAGTPGQSASTPGAAPSAGLDPAPTSPAPYRAPPAASPAAPSAAAPGPEGPAQPAPSAGQPTPPAASPAAPSAPAGPPPQSAASLELRQRLGAVRTEVAKAVVGQDAAVTGLVIALLCRGHVLLEGVPGVAKTLL